MYGEIDFHSFSQILKEIRPLFKPEGKFVDLGSGTGRPCFAMALLSDMKRIVGIEALEQLSEASKQILEQYENFVESDEVEVEDEEAEAESENDDQQSSSTGSPLRVKAKTKIVHSPLAKLERRASIGGASDLKRVEMIRGDFLKIDWSQ